VRKRRQAQDGQQARPRRRTPQRDRAGQVPGQAHPYANNSGTRPAAAEQHNGRTGPSSRACRASLACGSNGHPPRKHRPKTKIIRRMIWLTPKNPSVHSSASHQPGAGSAPAAPGHRRTSPPGAAAGPRPVRGMIFERVKQRRTHGGLQNRSHGSVDAITCRFNLQDGSLADLVTATARKQT